MAVLGTISKSATEDYGWRIEKVEVWILEIEGKPVGVVILEINTDHLLIYSISVIAAAQGNDHGKELLDFADSQAIEHELDEVRLYTNERMERTLSFTGVMVS